MKNNKSILDFTNDELSEKYNLPPKELWVIDGVDACLVDNPDGLLNTPYYDTCKKMTQEVFTQKLVYFCEKLGVEFADEGNINRLKLKTGLNNMDYKNLLLLNESEFVDAIGINGSKLYKSLHNKVLLASPQQLADATGCFGQGIGELKLNKIVEKYGELPYDEKKILSVEGWAEKSVLQYMSKYIQFVDMIQFFQKYNMWKGFDCQEVKSDKYNDLKVVFTGVRSKELENIIKENGGSVLSSVSNNCTLVVAKDPSGSSSKLQKARDGGIEIISLEEAIKRFGNRG